MRKIILFIFLLFSIALSAQVKVVGYLTTLGVSDIYATHLDSLGSGGYMATWSKTTRDAIPSARRKQGMMVYCVTVDTAYVLKGGITNSNWSAFSSGGGGTTYTAGYRMGLSGTTFNNLSYWKDQDTLNVGDGLVLSTSKKLTPVTNNSANWNTAYGWGNHASAGYVTGTPWVGLYWAKADTSSTLETKAYNNSKLALKQSIANMVNATSTSATKYPTWYAMKAYADSVKGTISASQWTTATNEIYNNNSGKVGIGITNPSSSDSALQALSIHSTRDINVNGLTVGKGKKGLASNTAFGTSSLSSITNGANNTGFGYRTLASNSTGSWNTAVGYNALSSQTGSGSTAVGYSALGSNTGASNTAVGTYSLQQNSTGTYNTAIGASSMSNATNTGHYNTASGYSTLCNNSTGYGNTANGYTSLTLNNSGSYNVGYGYKTLQANTIGFSNIAIGVSALYSNTTGHNNIALGDSAGYTYTTLSNRMYLGARDTTTTGIYWDRTPARNLGWWNGSMYVKTVPYATGTTLKMLVQDTVTGQVKRQAIAVAGGGGTVTSIATTSPIMGGTITTTGTISLDTTKAVLFNDTLPGQKIATKKNVSDATSWTQGTGIQTSLKDTVEVSAINTQAIKNINGVPFVTILNDSMIFVKHAHFESITTDSAALLGQTVVSYLDSGYAIIQRPALNIYTSGHNGVALETMGYGSGAWFHKPPLSSQSPHPLVRIGPQFRTDTMPLLGLLMDSEVGAKAISLMGCGPDGVEGFGYDMFSVGSGGDIFGNALTIGDSAFSVDYYGVVTASSMTVGGVTVPQDLSSYLTSYTETDPLVYAWAKASTKPSYTYSEVGASASGHNHSGVYEPAWSVGTTTQYYRGDKSWQTLDKSAVGLGNVANTAQVTSVTGTAPVVSSGGTTPAISMAAASTSVSGYLTSTDWNTFNGKQAAGSYITSGGALGTPSSGTLTNCTFPTLNQNTTGSAALLTTSRSIFGSSFNGSADLTGIIASTYGGTGNGFAKFTGPATSEKTFTLPNANATILTSNAAVTVAQGGTNATSASITAFNNISGYTASGATGTTSTNLVFSTSPVLTTPTIGAAIGTSIQIPTIPASNNSATGIIETDTANVNMGIGDVVFVGGTNGDRMVLCKADAIANCPYAFAICTATVTAGNVGTYLTSGDLRNDSWSWTKGAQIYVSTTGTTGNTLTQTAPSGANNVILCVGVAKTAKVIKFQPNYIPIEHN